MPWTIGRRYLPPATRESRARIPSTTRSPSRIQSGSRTIQIDAAIRLIVTRSRRSGREADEAALDGDEPVAAQGFDRIGIELVHCPVGLGDEPKRRGAALAERPLEAR